MDIRRRRHHCHPIAAPPSPSLRRHLLCHRCAPSLRPILRRHCCAATTIAAQPPPPPSLRDHNKHTGLPSARQRCLCLPALADDTNATIKSDE
jgi:hypothetical protein